MVRMLAECLCIGLGRSLVADAAVSCNALAVVLLAICACQNMAVNKPKANARNRPGLALVSPSASHQQTYFITIRTQAQHGHKAFVSLPDACSHKCTVLALRPRPE